MAKDGRKLELYEILAAKRAKGKVPLGLNANAPAPEETVTDAPGLIIDDSLGEEFIERRRAELRNEQPEQAAETETDAKTPQSPQTPPSAESRRDVPQEREAPKENAPPERERPITRHGYIPIPPEPAQERPDWQERVEKQKQTRRYAEKAVSQTQHGQNHAQSAQSAPGGLDAPEPAPRPRSPREIVIALDTGLIFFTVVLALLGCSYFIGYKRGQEERPAGLAGVTEIETADPNRLSLRNLAPAPRAAIRPPEQDFTLIIRKEPATENDLPERLELELAEAVARGRNAAGREIPGFIFRTVGNDPHFILAVGLGQNANDQGLNELLQIYYAMEGVTLSREPAPYRGCRIAPIRELGTAVY